MRGSAQHIYENIYCRRGDFENRIKELKNDLCMDRTSCTSFLANQFRVLMTTAAFALFQEIRRRSTQLIKLAARVTSSARRIVFHLPRPFAYRADWLAVASPLTT